MSFKPVNPKVNFARQEEELLKFWDKQKIFAKSVALRRAQGEKNYIFFEGPPSANAKPGVHHVLPRAFKDLWPRYKTMQGFWVERKAGWDTHGLPVEVAVEKELGLKNKQDIEKYGVAKFNAKCRETVWRYKEDWNKLTARMAFWLDLENPYITYDPNYIESLWWIIKQIWDKGLLYKGYKVVPRCTRCGTALSSHEVAQGYREVHETSLYVKFKVKATSHKPQATSGDTFILVWTTTPWTLPGNVALAVGNKISYCKLKVQNEKLKTSEYYILAQELVEKVFGDETVEVVEKYKGKDLIGLEYEPLFPGAVPKTTTNYDKAFEVYPADFVTTEEGTGIVHTAVMYGDDDYQLGEQVGLPNVHTVSEDGLFLPSVKQWAGKYVKDPEVERGIINDLGARGLLLKEMPYTHDYPFCWRCDSPLLYYAADSWFIAMSKLRKQLLDNNQKINWVPEHIKDGRFGEWLQDVKDWAFSRERYWGTPLPLWKSDDGDFICVGSFDELRKYAKEPDKIAPAPRSSKSEGWDPHKPFIDEIILEKDEKEYHRVPEIIDVWFDSGAMPFAQWHYPHENRDRIDKGESYPADFIAEAVDQTRGWFYTLLAIATLLDKGAPYTNVVCLGHVLDKHGKKMSKSKDNVVDPWQIFDKYGSDALRWYLYSMNQPGVPKNFDEDGVKQVVRRFMLTLWNTYSFFVTYANIDGFDGGKLDFEPKHDLDKWILARYEQLVRQITAHLEAYEPMQACMVVESFVEDLSNWYIRRSRRRFWKGKMNADKLKAYSTLYYVLKGLAKVLAPFMPFLSEEIYQNLRLKSDPLSVHLDDWPSKMEVDTSILQTMHWARQDVEWGLNQREIEGIKVRQPLSEFITEIQDYSNDIQEIIRDELNVKTVRSGSKRKLDIKITKELKIEGAARELVREIQVLRKQQGFAIEDRIKITWASSDEEVSDAIAKHADYIKTEVLATELTEKGNQGEEVKVNGSVVKLGLERDE